MALIPCLECQHKISDQAKACPQCGVPTENYKKLKRNVSIFKIAAILAIPVLIFIWNMIQLVFRS